MIFFLKEMVVKQTTWRQHPKSINNPRIEVYPVLHLIQNSNLFLVKEKREPARDVLDAGAKEKKRAREREAEAAPRAKSEAWGNATDDLGNRILPPPPN